MRFEISLSENDVFSLLTMYDKYENKSNAMPLLCLLKQIREQAERQEDFMRMLLPAFDEFFNKEKDK